MPRSPAARRRRSSVRRPVPRPVSHQARSAAAPDTVGPPVAEGPRARRRRWRAPGTAARRGRGWPSRRGRGRRRRPASRRGSSPPRGRRGGSRPRAAACRGRPRPGRCGRPGPARCVVPHASAGTAAMASASSVVDASSRSRSSARSPAAASSSMSPSRRSWEGYIGTCSPATTPVQRRGQPLGVAAAGAPRRGPGSSRAAGWAPSSRRRRTRRRCGPAAARPPAAAPVGRVGWPRGSLPGRSVWACDPSSPRGGGPPVRALSAVREKVCRGG